MNPHAVPHQSPAMASAWADYQRDLETIREGIFAMDLAADPAAQAGAQYLFLQAQAAAFNLVIAPRSTHPAFYLHTFYEPNVYNWLLSNPDFLMRVAFVDGARSFVVRGRRSNSRFLEIQTIRGFWGDPRMTQLANYDLDDFVAAADGRFEIGVGPEPLPGIPNWIATDPSSANNTLLVRECFYDWQRESVSVLTIEPLDRASPLPLDEAELIRRLDAARRMMRFALDTYCGPFTSHVLGKGGINHFFVEDTSADDDGRSNPSALYLPAVYDIADDEALIIELTIGDARYWSVQLGDVWLQATDWVYRQSSLNGHYARPDADGKTRVVLAARDPGVANWLDVGPHLKGVAVVRAYFVEDFAPPLTVRVPLRELAGHLPDDTATVTADTRAEALYQRSRAALRRYGY